MTRQNIRYSGVNCALGPLKCIRYSGVCFHISYCNAAGLSNVVRYNGVFVIAGCHCKLSLSVVKCYCREYLLRCQ